MDEELKKKLKFVGITFLLLLVPFYFLFRYAYSDYLNDRALNLVIGSSSLGYTEKEAKEKAVSYLEKAKSYRKRYYILYYNQAKLYLELQNYDLAEKTLSELLKIRPDYDKGYLFYGMALELNHKPDSAKLFYRDYRNKVDRQFFDAKPDKRNSKQYRSYRLMLDGLLRDEQSFNDDLQYLESEFPGFEPDDNLKDLQSAGRSDLLLEYMGISKPLNLNQE